MFSATDEDYQESISREKGARAWTLGMLTLRGQAEEESPAKKTEQGCRKPEYAGSWKPGEDSV